MNKKSTKSSKAKRVRFKKTAEVVFIPKLNEHNMDALTNGIEILETANILLKIA